MRFHWTHVLSFALGAVVGITVFALACPPVPVPGGKPASVAPETTIVAPSDAKAKAKVEVRP